MVKIIKDETETGSIKTPVHFQSNAKSYSLLLYLPYIRLPAIRYFQLNSGLYNSIIGPRGIYLWKRRRSFDFIIQIADDNCRRDANLCAVKCRSRGLLSIL